MKFDFKWQPLAANLYGWLVCERADGRLRLFTCGTSKEISRAEFGLLLDLIETAWAFLCNDSAACGMLCFMTDTCFVWRCPTCGDTTIAMNRWSARLNDDGLKALLNLCRDAFIALEMPGLIERPLWLLPISCHTCVADAQWVMPGQNLDVCLN